MLIHVNKAPGHSIVTPLSSAITRCSMFIELIPWHLQNHLADYKRQMMKVIPCVSARVPYQGNTLSPEQNGHHFADDIFNYIYLLLRYVTSLLSLCGVVWGHWKVILSNVCLRWGRFLALYSHITHKHIHVYHVYYMCFHICYVYIYMYLFLYMHKQTLPEPMVSVLNGAIWRQ